MKIILHLLFLASIANAKYLRRLQESKLFHFIPAADYIAASTGIVPEPSTEGTDNLSQLKAGNFIHYAISMPVEESYLLQVRLASPDGGGSFDITNFETGDVYATFDDLPASGNWQRYKHINRFVTLPAGEYTLSVNVKEQGFNLLWLYLKQQDATMAPVVPTAVSPASPPAATPPAATPIIAPATSPVAAPTSPTMSMAPVLTPVALPVAPPVAAPVNPPVTEYNPDEMDKWALMIDAADFSTMQGIEVQSTSEGNRFVAFLDPGDYIEYMVDFPMAGKYKVSMSVASPDGDGGLLMNVGTQEGVAFTDVMPMTTEWTSFETATIQINVMTTGLQAFRIDILEAGWNFAWLYFYHDMAHDCSPTLAPSVLKEILAHDCGDEALPALVVPEPTPEPTSAPSDCHNSTEGHTTTMGMGV